MTKRCACDSVEKLAAMLAEAQIDLNPQQGETAKKTAHLAPALPEKLEQQFTIPNHGNKARACLVRLCSGSREIERQTDALLEEISRHLEQRVEQETLFALRWQLV